MATMLAATRQRRTPAFVQVDGTAGLRLIALLRQGPPQLPQAVMHTRKICYEQEKICRKRQRRTSTVRATAARTTTGRTTVSQNRPPPRYRPDAPGAVPAALTPFPQRRPNVRAPVRPRGLQPLSHMSARNAPSTTKHSTRSATGKSQKPNTWPSTPKSGAMASDPT